METKTKNTVKPNRAKHYKCPYEECGNDLDVMIPHKDQVTSKGFWDSLCNCPACEQKHFYRIYPDGKLEIRFLRSNGELEKVDITSNGIQYLVNKKNGMRNGKKFPLIKDGHIVLVWEEEKKSCSNCGWWREDDNVNEGFSCYCYNKCADNDNWIPIPPKEPAELSPDVEKMAERFIVETDFGSSVNWLRSDVFKGFIAGYKKASEELFTKEQMIEFAESVQKYAIAFQNGHEVAIDHYDYTRPFDQMLNQYIKTLKP